MGTGGGIWDTADKVAKTRLNQKTLFVGTGSDINAISPTYAGQLAFCTSTGSGFLAGRLYIRNETNTAWLASLVFDSASQTLTNKTIDADLNTISNIENADIKTAAAIAYSKLALNNSILPADLTANARRPRSTTGSSSSGSAGASNTNWTAAIGQISHTVLTANNIVQVIATGEIYNSAGAVATQTGWGALYVNGSAVYSRTFVTYNDASHTEYRPFTFVYYHTNPSAAAQTYDIRIRNDTSSTGQNYAVQHVIVRALEFGG